MLEFGQQWGGVSCLPYMVNLCTVLMLLLRSWYMQIALFLSVTLSEH